jgi:hypothetical protein
MVSPKSIHQITFSSRPARKLVLLIPELLGVPEPVCPEHLVVGEVERMAHALVAGGPGVVLVPFPAAGLAGRAAHDEWAAPLMHPALCQPGAPERGLPHCRVSVFFALARYRMVKITCSCSEVLMQTMKSYKADYSLS